MLQIASSGAYTDLHISDWTSEIVDIVTPFRFGMITNADRGVVLTWQIPQSSTNDLGPPLMAITDGTSATVLDAPDVAGGHVVTPVLQAQDGSFIGTGTDDTDTGYTVAFDATGNVRWTVPGYQPQIATADGGVIATDPNTGSAVTFDQNGNATGQLGSLPTYSWPGYVYQSSGVLAQIRRPMIDFGLSFAPFAGGSPSNSRTYIRLIEAKVFVPLEIAKVGDPPQTADFAARLSNRYKKTEWGQTIMDVEVLAFGKAAYRRFVDAYATTNMFVAYIGHGVSFPSDPVVLQDPNTFHASALEFAGTNYFSVGQPGDLPITPKAKVIFLGACGIDGTFLAQWNIYSTLPNGKPSGQALISPDPYPPPKQPDRPLYHEIDLVLAAEDLQYLLDQFLPASSRNPNTTISVQGALDILNPTDAPQMYGWKVSKGDQNVKFGATQ